MPKSYYPGQNPPDETTLQDLVDEIDNLKRTLDHVLEGIVSLQQSVKQIKEQINELPGEIERL